MNKRTRIISVAAIVTAVTAGGVTYAVAQDSDGGSDNDAPVTDSERQQATDAAVAEAGGGTVTDVEHDDGSGYEVEVRLDDGSEVDVDLDSQYQVVLTEVDPPESNEIDDDEIDDADADDQPVNEADRQRASDAALAAAGAGTVTDVEHDDGGGFDVEVRLDDGTEVDVELGADFSVVRTESDTETTGS